MRSIFLARFTMRDLRHALPARSVGLFVNALQKIKTGMWSKFKKKKTKNMLC